MWTRHSGPDLLPAEVTFPQQLFLGIFRPQR
jgi:hypothetical protein